MSTNEKRKVKVVKKSTVSTNALTKVKVVRYDSPSNLLGRNKFDLRRNKS